MGLDPDTTENVGQSEDQRRDILRAFVAELKAGGTSVKAWAKRSAVNENSIYNFINGHSHSLDDRTYAKLARGGDVPVWRLTGDPPDAPSPTTVWVAGHVQAGAFRAAVEWDRSLWYPVDVPVPVRMRGKAKALELRGPSMNEIYPDGSIVIWVDMLDYRPPRHEDRVIVYAYSDDDEIEATVKEFREIEGRRWLWPRSFDPDHQVPIDPATPPNHIRRIEVVGIVVGSYRPEAL